MPVTAAQRKVPFGKVSFDSYFAVFAAAAIGTPIFSGRLVEIDRMVPVPPRTTQP
ncbi:MAG TPA: hypothetical protein VL985_14795 [Stellaceae bacterium]|nr:hypothetical protein [Stellaceae bacterium]